MQQNKLMRKTAVLSIMFVLTSMCAMLYYSANKIVVVADVAQDEVIRSAQEEQGSTITAVVDKNHITIERNTQNTNYLCIPMPDTVKAEDVTLENHYMDQELWVNIQGKGMSDYDAFYENNAVYGNSQNVLDGHFEVENNRIYLRFSLTGVYEYRSIFENQTLYVEFVPSKEVYEKIIVVDPAYGAAVSGVTIDNVMAKDITLDIAKALKTKFDETDIKVYYTRMDDSNPAPENRVNLATATKADMLIRIEVSGNENSKLYGTETVYNGRYFIPGFGSVELADILEREVVTAISGKANGLVEATDADEVIGTATVPAAAVKVGYLTNGQEAILLQREDYINRIAEGIYNAVMKAYEGEI